MSRKFKIIVPKPAASNELGTEIELLKADEIVESKGDWHDSILDQFVENGWAMEVKVDSADEVVDVEAEIKRARNEDGTLKGDDPETPDVNEAWEGGKAPVKKAAKKKTTKRTTKKKA